MVKTHFNFNNGSANSIKFSAYNCACVRHWVHESICADLLISADRTTIPGNSYGTLFSNKDVFAYVGLSILNLKCFSPMLLDSEADVTLLFGPNRRNLEGFLF